MALLGALCIWLNSLGFTNRSLRAQVSQLLGVAPQQYTVNQMSYDLARLRRKGLIVRRPGTNTYDLTAEGQRVALFYTKVHDRLLGPLIAADQPPAPPQLQRALATIERHIAERVEQSALGKAA
jgi:predicted MarR family transcription regulator